MDSFQKVYPDVDEPHFGTQKGLQRAEVPSELGCGHGNVGVVVNAFEVNAVGSDHGVVHGKVHQSRGSNPSQVVAG